MINQEINTSPHKFSSQLFESVAKQTTGGNYLFSPVSIYLTLLMATSGAKGETFVELAKCLGLNHPSVTDFRKAVEEYASKFFTKINPDLLHVANNAFVSDLFPLHSDYAEHVKKAFHVNAVASDFVENPEDSRNQINEWVSTNTNNKINNILTPGSISRLTKVVLVNAIHFLGKWQHVFNPSLTKSATFYGVDGDSKVEMMFDNKNSYYYGTEGAFHWVSLGFTDNNYKMTFITTKEKKIPQDTLDEFAKNKLSTGVESFKVRNQKVALSLPKFELEHSVDIKSILGQAPFNVKLAFSADADFTNMTANNELFIDAIYHKAMIKVDEKGAEAVAATVLSSSTSGVPTHFEANRPFVFVLSAKSTKSTLFVGKINKF